MRVHLSMNLMREVIAPMTMDGYDLKPGSLCFVPMEIAHRDENWAVDGYPASQFWAERHVKEVERIDESGQMQRKAIFRLGGNSSSSVRFFPYGTCLGHLPQYLLHFG